MMIGGQLQEIYSLKDSRMPQDKKLPKDASMEVGYSGTEIYSGYITSDEQQKWRQLQTRCDTIEEMIDSDATTKASLEAVKAPLLSAKYYIEPASEDAKDIEIAEFIEKALFEKINFRSFLRSAFSAFDYGFSLFEKVFYICPKDGLVYWKKFAERLPESIESWNIGGAKWEDGHPVGITQRVYNTDEERAKGGIDTRLQSVGYIPWNKLLRFTVGQRGNNFEGKSLLRSAYIHWYMKNLLYKVAGIAADRWGVGIPYAKVAGNLSDEQKAEVKNMLRYIRSNEQSYMYITEKIQEYGILTPSGTGNLNSFMKDMIDHHDKKIYDSILAGFLNLSTGDGGSNALSKDQSSFFLKCVENYALHFCSVIDEAIQELVWINFGEQEYYPKLKVTNIGTISMDEFIASITAAVNGGLLSWSEFDEDKLREELKLPERQEFEEDESEEMEQEETKEDISQDEKERLESDEDESEVMQNSEKKRLRIPDRERFFVGEVSKFENYLGSEYGAIERYFATAEKKLNEYMRKMYAKTDLERIDGVKVLAQTKKNTAIKNQMLQKVDQVTKELNARMIRSPIMDRLFRKAAKMSTETLKEIDVKLADRVVINKGKFNSYVAGYISNMQGVLYNDPRRVKERIELEFGSQNNIDLIYKSLENPIFNRNVLKLSSITHARAAFNGNLYDASIKNGYTFFKTMVPKQRLKDVAPTGATGKFLYTVATAATINQIMNDRSDGKNTGVIDGLGLHHGSYTYYMPVPSDEVKYYEELARQQREEWLASVENTEGK